MSLRPRVIPALTAALVVTAGAGCGGSASTAGIEGTGLTAVSGPITGFGSIFVDGIEFDTTSASILVNGQAATQSQLHAGQVVDVTGSVAANGTSGSATTVQFNPNVQGPVSAVDVAGSSLTVLGQIVKVGTSTSFGTASGATPTLASIAVGTLVEVSGYTDSAGDILATRIDVESQLDQYIIVGTVEALDAANHRFTLNSVEVDFTSATLADFPGGRVPQNGDKVEIVSMAASGGGAVTAAQVQFIGTVGTGGEAGRLQGVITRYVSASDFDVAGAPVTTTAGTSYENGTAANLALDARVDVEGTFNDGGMLVADDIQFAQSAPLLVRSVVQSVDAAAGTLTVLGITVTTNRNTRFDDQSAAPVSPFNLSSLQIGDTVEVRGSAAAANTITATLLTREMPGSVEVRGTATAVAAPALTVLGVGAETGAGTQYLQDAAPIGAAQFFAAAPGAIVDLQGSLVGGVLDVSIAQLPGVGQLQ